jgi:hypothetical protein
VKIALVNTGILVWNFLNVFKFNSEHVLLLLVKKVKTQDWRHGSHGRAPALRTGSSEFFFKKKK